MNPITETVRERYAEAAKRAAAGERATCGCGPDPAGFTEVEIETTRVYSVDDARAFLGSSGLDVDAIAPLMEGRVTSAFVRARKPEAASCCTSTCCA